MALIFGMATVCFADKYYVFIDKVGKVDVGQEAGQNGLGDVVAITPFTPQYKPTIAELSRYHVIVVDLTKIEKAQLLEEETKIDGQDSDGNDLTIPIRARRRKIDFKSLSNKTQEVEITKSEIFQKVTVKPDIIIVAP